MRSTDPTLTTIVFEIIPSDFDIEMYQKARAIKEKVNRSELQRRQSTIIKTEKSGVQIFRDSMRDVALSILNQLELKFALEIKNVEDIVRRIVHSKESKSLQEIEKSLVEMHSLFHGKYRSEGETLEEYFEKVFFPLLRDRRKNLDEAQNAVGEIKTLDKYSLFFSFPATEVIDGIRVTARTRSPEAFEMHLMEKEDENTHYCGICKSKVNRPDERCRHCAAEIGWVSGGGFTVPTRHVPGNK